MSDLQMADVVNAQGKFVVFVASLLQRGGVANMTDFAALLATFAATVEETEPTEAEILGSWASAVRKAIAH
jgi:hypothetical protein